MSSVQPPDINVVVVDDYTKAKLKEYKLLDKRLEISFEGKNQNFELRVKEIEESLGHRLDPIVKDLYKIAAAVYYCDLQMHRPSSSQGRSMRILISVSDKSRWDGEKHHLELTFAYLTYDNIVFHFVQGERPKTEFRFRARDSRVISLFSGGLDSLAGVKWLKTRGLRPVLVSHTASNIIHNTIKTLLTGLEPSFDNKLDLLTVSASRRGEEARRNESIQPSRSFLYLTLGCVFALEMGISKVFLFENGVIALNVPLVQSRIYSHTRTAHPKFISDFNRLIADIFPNTVTVETPFEHMTKGEVVTMLDDPSFRGLVKETISCSRASMRRWSRGSGRPKNCGICLPCIVRRVAIHRARLWDLDARYTDDVLGNFSDIPQDGKTLLLQILHFGLKLNHDYEDILGEIHEFYVEGQDPKVLIDMMRRHHLEVVQCFRERGGQTLRSNIQQFLH